MTLISKTMKKLMILTVAVCAALASCQSSKSLKSFSEIDSLSYAIGMDLALNMGVRPLEDSLLNVGALTAGFRDAWNSKEQMTMNDASAFIREYFQIRKPAKDRAADLAWFEEVRAANPGVQQTADGLLYEIVDEGDPEVKAVNDSDQVTVGYTLSLRGGRVVQQVDSIQLALSRQLPAWNEGVKLIGRGGRVNLWIPAEQAYGAQGSGSIPPNSALKYEIRLIDVLH
jgi:FKBP-type peptidyl-prolyl cis-trans isomerase